MLGWVGVCVCASNRTGSSLPPPLSLCISSSPLAPLPSDALNFQKNVHHFWTALGGWTFALNDYYEMNFTRRVDDPNMPKVVHGGEEEEGRG